MTQLQPNQKKQKVTEKLRFFHFPSYEIQQPNQISDNYMQFYISISTILHRNSSALIFELVTPWADVWPWCEVLLWLLVHGEVLHIDLWQKNQSEIAGTGCSGCVNKNRSLVCWQPECVGVMKLYIHWYPQLVCQLFGWIVKMFRVQLVSAQRGLEASGPLSESGWEPLIKAVMT